MSEPKNGGCAFPNDGAWGNGHQAEGGMSLRDWFAGQAIIGILSQGAIFHAKDAVEALAIAGSSAYQIADALLAERQKEKP